VEAEAVAEEVSAAEVRKRTAASAGEYRGK
jgi:hypothetical protein